MQDISEKFYFCKHFTKLNTEIEEKDFLNRVLVSITTCNLFRFFSPIMLCTRRI